MSFMLNTTEPDSVPLSSGSSLNFFTKKFFKFVAIPNRMRRKLVSCSTVALSGVFFTSRSSFASKVPAAENFHAMQSLINALKETQLPVCGEAAARLVDTVAHTHVFDLELRSAKLDGENAIMLAAAIHLATTRTDFQLRLFSASYNPEMGAVGAAAIVASMPSDLTEFGMVGCALNDEVGDAILQFMWRAASLKVICVEGNVFSNTMVMRIKNAGRSLKGCLIVV
jgi:hypothetical protein